METFNSISRPKTLEQVINKERSAVSVKQFKTQIRRLSVYHLQNSFTIFLFVICFYFDFIFI